MTVTAKTNSLVLATPPATSSDANAWFTGKLSCETDPSDVYSDMQRGVEGFILADVRSAEDYNRSHAQDAINLPQATINAESTAHLSKDTLLVVYCWGPGCNGATKAGAKLSALGFSVKEMIGGIEYWEDKERYPVVRGG